METAKPTDIELIAAYRMDGQSIHVGELFRRHLGRMRGLLYQLTLNHADADDLTQEVFLRAQRGLAGFGGRSEFATWLHRIALNCVKSHWARQSRRPLACMEDIPEPAGPCGERPDCRAAAAEMDGRIQSALERLSPKLRAAIVLTVLQDLSVPEAARLEQCGLPTMYWRVHEARRQLKQFLEKDQP